MICPASLPVSCIGSSASAIRATRQGMRHWAPPLGGDSGFSVTPRREAITAEGWVRDILSAGQRRVAGATLDEPRGHPLRWSSSRKLCSSGMQALLRSMLRTDHFTAARYRRSGAQSNPQFETRTCDWYIGPV